MANPVNRRSFRSFLSDRHSHLNLAVLSSVFIFLPSCIASVIAIYVLTNGVVARIENETPVNEIVLYVSEYATNATLMLVANFLIITMISAFLALKVTHHVVGPVQKLEDHLEDLLNNKYEIRSTLRKKDYLGELGRRLNLLSEKLQTKKT